MKTRATRKKTFRTEEAERKFWATHSPLDFFDTATARRASFPNLKPSLKSISIRLPEDMLDELKSLANKRDVPYQSLAKMYLAWAIRAERAQAWRGEGIMEDRLLGNSTRFVRLTNTRRAQAAAGKAMSVDPTAYGGEEVRQHSRLLREKAPAYKAKRRRRARP